MTRPVRQWMLPARYRFSLFPGVSTAFWLPRFIQSGPIFGFSDTWQLIINTATTVLTFLMVFVIQNTINRDSLAMHVKLDELIRATDEARNRMIGSEKLSETVLDQLVHEEEEEAGK